jgi:hypothetical protein
MKRRDFLLGLPLCGAGLAACGPTQMQSRADSAYSELAASTPKAAGAPKVVVFMPRTPQSMEVWAGLRDELASDFALVAVEVHGRDSVAVLEEGLRRHQPSAIVLMNNPTLSAYRELQQRAKVKKFPPSVVVMTSFLVRRPRLVATTGISYEVPLITVVTNMRKLIAKPINRIGIVMRPNLRGFVQHQVALAARERIGAVLEEVSAQPNAAEIKRALRIVKQHADALWVLNDDQLLTPRLITEGWLPGMNERPWVPAIVGAAPLVAPGTNFGTFAVLPDHTALGAQAANMILDVADNDWVLPDDMDVQLPLSTVATIDLVQARERFVLQSNALQMVDRVLQ